MFGHRRTKTDQEGIRLILPPPVLDRLSTRMHHYAQPLVSSGEVRSYRIFDNSDHILTWRDITENWAQVFRVAQRDDSCLSELISFILPQMLATRTGIAFFGLGRDNHILGTTHNLRMGSTDEISGAIVLDDNRRPMGSVPDVVKEFYRITRLVPHGVMGGECIIIDGKRWAPLITGFSASSDYDTLNTVTLNGVRISKDAVPIYFVINSYSDEPTAMMLMQLAVLHEASPNAALVVGHIEGNGQIKLRAWKQNNFSLAQIMHILNVAGSEANRRAVSSAESAPTTLAISVPFLLNRATLWGAAFQQLIRTGTIIQIPIVDSNGQVIESI